MKTLLKLFFLFTSLSYNASAQKLITIKSGCSYNGDVKNKQIYIRECKNTRILKIINDILSSISIQRNFDIYEANIQNAVATKYDNHRLIIIDPEFLNIIEEITHDKFASYLIIAHEIGHHLNAHIDKPSTLSPYWDELESDHFAGAALQKMGILPSTINNVTSLIAPQMTSSKTHPEWQARMKAAINGYCQSVFIETKRNLTLNERYDRLKISYEEKKLEQILNYNIYNKADWQKNIKYKVLDKKIFKEFETNNYNGKNQPVFRKEKYVITINDITKVFLRWHDPGEIEFETLTSSHIETIQNSKVASKLKPHQYFDNEDTINDDFNLMISIITSIGNIQRLSKMESMN